ncbi:unnamed protein product, partial [Ectocarpus sp. 12 AP-2014]
ALPLKRAWQVTGNFQQQPAHKLKHYTNNDRSKLGAAKHEQLRHTYISRDRKIPIRAAPNVYTLPGKTL